MTYAEKIISSPFYRLSIPAITGVVVAQWNYPLWVPIMAMVVSYAMVLIKLNYSLSSVYIYTCLVATFMLLAKINDSTLSQSNVLANWQTAAVERLEKLPMERENLSITEAMSVGFRGDISKEQRQVYSRSGFGHILAVSGLHVGVIFILLNIVLRPLYLLHYKAHTIIPFLIVALVWLYVFVTGCSPSAVRAGIMFSLIQIGMATSSNSSSINSLFAALLIILTIEPKALYSLSLQMSFIAVLFILTWFVPLYKRVRTKYRLVNIVIGAYLIGFVANMALTPLISYKFGVVTLPSLIIMPFASMSAYIIIPVTILWVLFPIMPLAPFVAKLLDALVGAQNALALWCSESMSIDFQLPLWGAAIIYVLYFVSLQFIKTHDK